MIKPVPKDVYASVIFSEANQALSKENSYALDNSTNFIYLTFDDGPDSGTLGSFKTCLKNKVNASYFMVSNQLENPLNLEIFQFLNSFAPLFYIGNHSHSHGQGTKYYNFYSDTTEIKLDFSLAANKLNIKNKIARIPGNNSWNTKSVNSYSLKMQNAISCLDKLGYKIIGWDIEWNFDKSSLVLVESASQIYQRILFKLNNNLTKTPNHLVILMHDRTFQMESEQLKLDSLIKLIKNHEQVNFTSIDRYP